jgi:hypothetical protein
MWSVSGCILMTPCAVCYCNITMSLHSSSIVWYICSGH